MKVGAFWGLRWALPVYGNYDFLPEYPDQLFVLQDPMGGADTCAGGVLFPPAVP